jgi:hypothetical protein
MFVRITKLILSVSLVVVVAGCEKNPVFGKNGNFRLKDAGPDEFSILPTKELELPEDFETLPEPTLGSRNRVDLTPERDAVAALGGNPEQLDSTLIGSGEQPLVTAASRFGVSADIRETLANEDAEYSKKIKPRFFERWVYSDNAYLKRRKNDSLNAYEELERLRSIGVRTPSAPPAQSKKKTLKLGTPYDGKLRKGQNI